MSVDLERRTMSDITRASVDHVAIKVQDMRWYLDFFTEALGMRVTDTDGDPRDPQQAWLIGGI